MGNADMGVPAHSQEWFAIKLAKIRDMMHNDLYYAKTEAEMDAILKEVGIHLRQVKEAVYEITDLFMEDDIHALVVNRLLESEDERQSFFRKYGVMSAYDNICKQMIASA